MRLVSKSASAARRLDAAAKSRREQLLDRVWGVEYPGGTRTVDVHVRRLRQQVERDDANPELILTVRSVGYRFNPEALG